MERRRIILIVTDSNLNKAVELNRIEKLWDDERFFSKEDRIDSLVYESANETLEYIVDTVLAILNGWLSGMHID